MGRTTQHGLAQAWKGDMVVHDGHIGAIVEGSEHCREDGNQVALLGHIGICMKCKPHKFPIVTGELKSRVHGRPRALDTHRLECGAVIVAKKAPERVFEIAQAMFNGTHYDQHFHVKDKTGKPLANAPYQITLGDGRKYQGTTDSSGLTQKVYSDSPQTATIEVPYHGDSAGTTHTDNGSDTCGC